jgi:hypothetical protein
MCPTFREKLILSRFPAPAGSDPLVSETRAAKDPSLKRCSAILRRP